MALSRSQSVQDGKWMLHGMRAVTIGAGDGSRRAIDVGFGRMYKSKPVHACRLVPSAWPLLLHGHNYEIRR